MSGAGAFDWKRVPFRGGVRILDIHPCGLAAIDKPAGVLSHPNRSGDAGRAVVTGSYDAKEQRFTWSGREGQACGVWLLHRLDSATSGVLLLAADEAVAVAVKHAFEHRTVTKKYLAVVFGHLRERHALWRDRLSVRRGGDQVRADAGGSAGVSAETQVHRVKLVPGPPALTLLEFAPRTGRTHQLRVQSAKHDYPIVGDKTYGNFRANRDFARRFGTDRLFLHAASIAVEIRVGGKKVYFRASAPEPQQFVAFGMR